MLNTRVCASAFAAILCDCIIVQRSIPWPRRRQQPALHLIFHQGRVRPRHRQSRGTWRRRCWLGCETRLTAVTCYGAPSTSDLRPCAMTKATSCTFARCPPRTWKRQCQTPPSTRSCQASTPRHVTRSRGACACTGSPA